MLIGSAVHNLDAKGRIVIPSKYRDDLGSTVFAFKAMDGCIRIYHRDEFARVLEKLRTGDVNQIMLRRKISGSAEQLTIDSQGRVLLPELLRTKAGITDRVRMVGMIDWIELWNEDGYEQAEDLSYEDEVRCMAELGLA